MKPLKLVFVAAVVALAGACSSTPPAQNFPPVTYSQLGTIPLDVRSVEVVWAYSMPYAPPNVEHLFPTPPGVAAERWAKDRLKPVGREGVAKFIIRDASVVQQKLSKTGGVAGAFTTDQSDRYVATLRVELVANDDVGAREGKVTAGADLTQTVAENATLNDLERTWYGMSQQLMKQLNDQLESGIKTYLRPFTR